MDQEQQNQHQSQCLNHECPLCTGQNFAVMLNRALYDRYLANINLYYTESIDDFIEDQITPATCKFREQICDADDEELLKRQYGQHEFRGKIQVLSEYYKFHRDVPKIFEKSVFKMLGKYYDRLRHFDYKKIKCVLKQQQGISLTTQKSDQSSFYSDEIIKSRYSTVLHELNKNSQNESQILHDFCQKVDKAYQKMNLKKDFKGQYYSGQKKFEQYLFNVKKLNSKVSKVNFAVTNPSQRAKNYNLLQKPLNNAQINSLTLKTQRVDTRKKSLKKKNPDIVIQANNALKQSLKNFKKVKNKNSKSIEKTTANETISRQQKSRKMQKLQKTLQYEIQKNHNTIFKPFSTALLNLKSNVMLKTLDQIYKPVSVNEKYHSDKSRKMSQQTAQNLHKLYQDKLSQRKSNIKVKSNALSLQNSKQTNQLQSHSKQFILINLNDKGQTQRRQSKEQACRGLKNKEPINKQTINKQPINKETINKETINMEPVNKEPPNTRCSSKKKLTRNRSSSKTLHTQKKSSKSTLKTIEHPTQKHLSRNSCQKKNATNEGQRLNNYLNSKLPNFNAESKPNLARQRSVSKKSLESGKKQRSSSKKSLHSTQKIQRSSSKSNITSARAHPIDKVKFHTIDPQANRNMEQFLERKLRVQSKNKPKAKFYN